MRVKLEMRAESHLRLHTKCSLFLSEIQPKWNAQANFLVKFPNIKFHKNPFSDSRVVTCGERPTDMPKLTDSCLQLVRTRQKIRNRNAVVRLTQSLLYPILLHNSVTTVYSAPTISSYTQPYVYDGIIPNQHTFRKVRMKLRHLRFHFYARDHHTHKQVL
jgi:hypothetical protein